MKLVIQITGEGDGPFDGNVILCNKTPYQCGLAFQTILKDLPNLEINLDICVEESADKATML